MRTEQILLASRPQGLPQASNYMFQEVELPPLQNEQVLLKARYISVDPYMRGRMSDRKSYIPPFELNAPITGGVVAEVLESKTPGLKKGDIVLGMLPWATYSISTAEGLQKLPETSLPLSYFLGVLGMPGLTAYFGIMDICKPKAGETVVISGAGGAVGSVAGQIAKEQGARVVGIAGSVDKVNLLKKQFKFDEVINYRTTPNLAEAIAEACPNGVNCYFDNVGGDITDAVVDNIAFHARIALCGQISLYNETSVPLGRRLLPTILTHSALIKGYIVSDYQAQFPQAQHQLALWINEGKIHFTETIQTGFKQLPDAFLGLFSGANIGKMIVQV